jgi:uncharacterized protein YcbX
MDPISPRAGKTKLAGRVTELNFYPVKSCAGTTLQQAEVGSAGLPFDRQWILVDEHGNMLTQRQNANIALIKPTVVADGTLTLSAPGMPTLTVPSQTDAPSVAITVWHSDCGGHDQGDAAAAWIQKYLRTPARLFRADMNSLRKNRWDMAPDTEATVAFADGYPLLVVSAESLVDLNSKLRAPIPMNRFRPSIVVQGLGAYAEDTPQQLQIGDVRLRYVYPCSRCVITTIDQGTATMRGPEPLKTLNTYRNRDGEVVFGSYYVVEKPGTISVGAPVLSGT